MSLLRPGVIKQHILLGFFGPQIVICLFVCEAQSITKPVSLKRLENTDTWVIWRFLFGSLLLIYKDLI